MSALAAHLRQRTAELVRQMEPDERIRIALALGDDDLRLYCEASGTSAEDARVQVNASRQAGRRASATAAPGQT